MKKIFSQVVERSRLGRVDTEKYPGEQKGIFLIRNNGKTLLVIICNSSGWDHVSLSLNVMRCPTWGEMCYIKDLFFDDNEIVVQFHPKKSDYIDYHPYTLHLWKSQREGFPTPEPWMVGTKK